MGLRPNPSVNCTAILGPAAERAVTSASGTLGKIAKLAGTTSGRASA
jgi:hypothetical protein